MPMISIEDIVLLDTVSKDINGFQNIVVHSKYGEENRREIKGLPGDVELNKPLEIHLGSTTEDINNIDHLDVCYFDEQGNYADSQIMWRTEDGTYRKQTQHEKEQTEKGNMAIAMAVINASAKRK